MKGGSFQDLDVLNKPNRFLKAKLNKNHNCEFYYSKVELISKSKELFFKYERINELYGKRFSKG